MRRSRRRARRPVVPRPVDLDDQLELRPVRVDLLAQHLRRSRSASAICRGRARGTRPPCRSCSRRCPLGGPRSPRRELRCAGARSAAPRTRGARRDQVESQVRGLVHDVRQPLDRIDLREIDDRPRDGRDRDAVAHRDVTRVQAPAVMHAHAGDAHLPRRDDGDRRGTTAPDPPENPPPPGGRAPPGPRPRAPGRASEPPARGRRARGSRRRDGLCAAPRAHGAGSRRLRLARRLEGPSSAQARCCRAATRARSASTVTGGCKELPRQELD